MRVAVIVSCVSLIVAAILVATAPASAFVPDALLAIAVPSEVYVDERIVMRAVVLVSEGHHLGGRLDVCEVWTATCHTSGWGTFTAPGTQAGFAGSIHLTRAGEYVLEWRLYDDWGVDSRRVVARQRREVTVHALAP